MSHGASDPMSSTASPPLVKEAAQPATAAAPAQIVNAVETLDETAEFLRRFVIFTNHAQVYAVVLWIVHCHAIVEADESPYLAITSAEKRSGKTRVLDLLELLVPSPWRVITPSDAVVF